MHPGALLLILFIVLPLTELYFLIKVGGWLGALPTVLLVVFTAVLGAGLVRWQGLATLERVRAAMGRGEVPAVPMLEAATILISGVLLLLPGFVTDTLGLLGLVPPLRRAIVRWLIEHFFIGPGGPGGGSAAGREPGSPRTLEGEFTVLDENRPENRCHQLLSIT